MDAFRSLSLFAGAQSVALICSLLRIPYAIEGAGVKQFGLLAIVVAIAPWLGLPSTALRTAVRVSTAEGRHQVRNRHHIRDLCRPLRTYVVALVVGGLGLLLIGQFVDDHLASLLLGGVSVAALLAVVQGPGSVLLGMLEGSGRYVLPNGLAAVSSFLGLGLTMAAAWCDAPFFVYAFAFLIPALGTPAVASLIAVSRWAPFASSGGTAPEPDSIPAVPVWRWSRILGIQQAQNGLDPLIIGSFLGPIAAAQFSVAGRLGQIVATVPAGVQPVIVRIFGAARQRDTPRGLFRRMGRVSASLASLVLLIAVTLGAASSWVTRLLTSGELQVPHLLIGLVLAQGVLFAWQVPVVAALSGSEGAKVLARWFPAVASVNVLLTVLFVRHGVWVPTAVSVLTSLAGHLVLFGYLWRRPQALAN